MRSRHKARSPGQALPKESKGVKKILLMGVFWRILAIEAILLVFSLLYRALFQEGELHDLVWYALRITLLIGIIILFMMATLSRFLKKKIISPLEAIALANRYLQEHDPRGRHISLPSDAPKEIREIAASRSRMLENILQVSEERLRLSQFIRDTFGRYLSRDVVEEILKSPQGAQVGGKKEMVTVLMSDLRGFTYLSEERDPEDLMRLLNSYLERMAEVILDYGGMIDEFIGDAILAVFGVPRKYQDHAARAVACGLAMQNALNQLNQEIAAQDFPSLEMGVGINTGWVIVGNMGSEKRLKYGIVGTPVNTAARIESSTVGGQVLVGESTYQLVRELVTADPPQTTMMKGLKKPLVCYPVRAIGSPYQVELQFQAPYLEGMELRLPFRCWKVEGKEVSGQAMEGETLSMSENLIVARIDPPLDPLTNIKLKFDFCVEAHCFQDIYAKTISLEEREGKAVNQLRITAISQKDKHVLQQWHLQAS